MQLQRTEDNTYNLTLVYEGVRISLGTYTQEEAKDMVESSPNFKIVNGS